MGSRVATLPKREVCRAALSASLALIGEPRWIWTTRSLPPWRRIWAIQRVQAISGELSRGICHSNQRSTIIEPRHRAICGNSVTNGDRLMSACTADLLLSAARPIRADALKSGQFHVWPNSGVTLMLAVLHLPLEVRRGVALSVFRMLRVWRTWPACRSSTGCPLVGRSFALEVDSNGQEVPAPSQTPRTYLLGVRQILRCSGSPVWKRFWPYATSRRDAWRGLVSVG